MHVLEINTSARQEGSMSRRLVDDLVAALQDRHAGLRITRRDIATGLPFIDEDWVRANFTPDGERSTRDREVLALSDQLVSELEAADIVVIGAPIYNFSVPATLKAWIDMVTRARKTFRYTESGVEGLLKGKKAYVIVPSGGVPVGSPVDFATPYMRHALGFIGITDVDVIAADQLNSRSDESIDAARVRIAELIHTAPRLQSRVA